MWIPILFSKVIYKKMSGQTDVEREEREKRRADDRSDTAHYVELEDIVEEIEKKIASNLTEGITDKELETSLQTMKQSMRKLGERMSGTPDVINGFFSGSPVTGAGTWLGMPEKPSREASESENPYYRPIEGSGLKPVYSTSSPMEIHKAKHRLQQANQLARFGKTSQEYIPEPSPYSAAATAARESVDADAVRISFSTVPHLPITESDPLYDIISSKGKTGGGRKRKSSKRKSSKRRRVSKRKVTKRRKNKKTKRRKNKKTRRRRR